MYRNYPRFYKKVISANKLIQQNTRYENNTQESATNNEQVQKEIKKATAFQIASKTKKISGNTFHQGVGKTLH